MWSFNSDFTNGNTEVDDELHSTSGNAIGYLLMFLGLQGNIGGAYVEGITSSNITTAIKASAEQWKEIYNSYVFNTDVLKSSNPVDYKTTDYYINYVYNTENNQDIDNLITQFTDFGNKFNTIKGLDTGEWRLSRTSGKSKNYFIYNFGKAGTENGGINNSQISAMLNSFKNIQKIGNEKLASLKRSTINNDQNFVNLPQTDIDAIKKLIKAKTNTAQITNLMNNVTPVLNAYKSIIDKYQTIAQLKATELYTLASQDKQENYDAVVTEIEKYFIVSNQEGETVYTDAGISFSTEREQFIPTSSELPVLTTENSKLLLERLQTAEDELNGLRNKAINELKTVISPNKELTAEQLETFTNQINALTGNSSKKASAIKAILEEAKLQALINKAELDKPKFANTEANENNKALNDAIANAQTLITNGMQADQAEPGSFETSYNNFLEGYNSLSEALTNAENANKAYREEKLTEIKKQLTNLPESILNQITYDATKDMSASDFETYLSNLTNLNNNAAFAKELSTIDININPSQKDELTALKNGTYTPNFADANVTTNSGLTDLINKLKKSNTDSLNKLKELAVNSNNTYNNEQLLSSSNQEEQNNIINALTEANTDSLTKITDSLKKTNDFITNQQNINKYNDYVTQLETYLSSNLLTDEVKNSNSEFITSLQEAIKQAKENSLNQNQESTEISNALNTLKTNFYDKAFELAKNTLTTEINKLTAPFLAQTKANLETNLNADSLGKLITDNTTTLQNVSQLLDYQQKITVNLPTYNLDDKKNLSTKVIFNVSSPESKKAYNDAYNALTKFEKEAGSQVVTPEQMKLLLDNMNNAKNNLSGKEPFLGLKEKLSDSLVSDALSDSLIATIQKQMMQLDSPQALIDLNNKVDTLVDARNNIVSIISSDTYAKFISKLNDYNYQNDWNQQNPSIAIESEKDLRKYQQDLETSAFYDAIEDINNKFNQQMFPELSAENKSNAPLVTKTINSEDEGQKEITVINLDNAKLYNDAYNEYNKNLGYLNQGIRTAWNKETTKVNDLIAYIKANNNEDVANKLVSDLNNQLNNFADLKTPNESNIESLPKLIVAKNLIQNNLTNTIVNTLATKYPYVGKDFIQVIANRTDTVDYDFDTILNNISSTLPTLNKDAKDLSDVMTNAALLQSDDSLFSLASEEDKKVFEKAFTDAKEIMNVNENSSHLIAPQSNSDDLTSSEYINTVAKALQSAIETIEKNTLGTKKQQAIETINKLSSLKQAEKTNFINSINSAKTIEEINNIVTEATKLNEINKALNIAKGKALDALEKLTNLSPAQVKQVDDSINSASTPEAVQQALDDAKALNAKIGELKTAQANATNAINALANLTQEQKDAYVTQINQATTPEAISQIQTQASELNNAIESLNSAIKNAEAKMNSTDYTNATPDSKASFDSALQVAKDAVKNAYQNLNASQIEQLATSLSNSEKVLDGNDAEAQKAYALKLAKEKAIKDLSNLTNLTEQQIEALTNQINSATTSEQVVTDSQNATAINTSMMNLINAMKQAKDVQDTDNFKYATLNNQTELVKDLVEYKALLTNGLANASSETIEAMTNKLLNDVKALNGDVNKANGKNNTLWYWLSFLILSIVVLFSGMFAYFYTNKKRNKNN
ncbi:GA module-containing protein [Mycoplasmopsis verecunda]|uniref:GA module n=1 Tax=Mycoplasmopsis verecunda TaxID=171291 RepID=A0A1T4LDR8_9BACT|nr:GA module-containing protein [Mycoplasmopsis verecunda]WPB54319.1 hypothetical protein SAM46_02405 [Mycoplasmopsis verecunda]SJZ52766.1 GA module [Mycoplasmopsis verecunda]